MAVKSQTGGLAVRGRRQGSEACEARAELLRANAAGKP